MREHSDSQAGKDSIGMSGNRSEPGGSTATHRLDWISWRVSDSKRMQGERSDPRAKWDFMATCQGVKNKYVANFIGSSSPRIYGCSFLVQSWLRPLPNIDNECSNVHSLPMLLPVCKWLLE